MADSVRCRNRQFPYKGHKSLARVITLDDSGRSANSLTIRLMQDLIDALDDAKDRMVVLTNAGRAFCGGLNRFELLRACATEGSCKTPLGWLVRLFTKLSTHPFPTVCLLAGSAAGGGVGLAFCCDVVVALDKRSFRIPGGGYRELARVLLPIIRHRGSVEGLSIEDFVGKEFSAAQAFRWELINATVKTRGAFAERMCMQLDRKDLWPPRRIHRTFNQGDLLKEIKRVRQRAENPEATRAIVGSLCYEVIRSVEKRLGK